MVNQLIDYYVTIIASYRLHSIADRLAQLEFPMQECGVRVHG